MFDYLAHVENMPSRATEFAREARRGGQRLSRGNGLGEFLIETAPIASFTMFQAPDMPDALFDAQHGSLAKSRDSDFLLYDRRRPSRSASVRMPSSELATVRSQDAATIAPHQAPSAQRSVPSSPRYSNAVPLPLARNS